MPPDDSKLARLLPGIAARGAQTQESVRKNARQQSPAEGLPSAYDAENKGRVSRGSISCLALSLLMGSAAFALSCIPQIPGGTYAFRIGSTTESIAGSPLQFWQGRPQNVLLYPQGDPARPFFLPP